MGQGFLNKAGIGEVVAKQTFDLGEGRLGDGGRRQAGVPLAPRGAGPAVRRQ
jgi:hypothetical protein